MATYYKWRKSTIDYDETVNNNYRNTVIPNIDNKVYYASGKPTVQNGEYVFPASEEILAGYNETLSYRDYISINGKNSGASCINGGATTVTNSGGDFSIDADNPVWALYTVSPKAGTSQGYVYSTSSSAYPNGGVQDGYYYDQRTTVQSPTAPTNITCPNPITTPTVTVSWTASQGVAYPIDRYVLSYKINGESSSSTTWFGNTTGTSIEFQVPKNATSVRLYVTAYDTNNEVAAAATGWIPVYLAPDLTVPQMVMQGQSVPVNWTAIDGASSYTLQRKANTDADWVQVYSGGNTTFSETAGTWTSVQYRVQAVFSGTAGGWATSASIPVISASALVISGTDGDLGTVVNDIPYTISTDTGNQITATISVNSAVIFSGNVGTGAADSIPVLDLVNGEGTIVIEASVQASSGTVTAARTWTYTKAPITFPDAGSVAQLTQQGANIWPKTLAECVRLPGGGTLDEITGFPAQVYTASYTGTGTYGASNPTQISFPFIPDLWGIVTTGGQGPANLFPWGATSIYGWTNTGYINATCSYSDKTVSISGASAVAQANSSNLEHCFIGIKVGTEAAE